MPAILFPAKTLSTYNHTSNNDEVVTPPSFFQNMYKIFYVYVSLTVIVYVLQLSHFYSKRGWITLLIIQSLNRS